MLPSGSRARFYVTGQVFLLYMETEQNSEEALVGILSWMHNSLTKSSSAKMKCLFQKQALYIYMWNVFKCFSCSS